MIKLVLSIFIPVLFIGNYWVCEFLYPGSGSSWDIFIPMDMLCHNIWSLTILVALVVSNLKTRFEIGNLFLLFAMNLSICDVLDRSFSIYQYNLVRYIAALGLSAIMATWFFILTLKKQT